MLEECGLPYSCHHLDLSLKEQKQDWFLELNPNGRIPVIVDRDAGNFVVMESGAILIYLAELCGCFYPSDRLQRSRVLQWLMFQMGGLGPMQGQAHVFYRYSEQKIDYAINRYQSETRRLYQVLNHQLTQTEYLAGKISIADFAAFPWVRRYQWAGVDIEDLPGLMRWCQQLSMRPGVKRGLDVPVPQAILKKRSSEQKVSEIRKII